MQSGFLKASKERGFLYQSTDLEALDEIFMKQKVKAYMGFDMTGPSLHVGHLIGIMWLRLLERMGHQPIVLIGGATTLIGDPSDKDKQRPLLSPEVVQNNIDSISKTFKKLLKNPIIVNNADWLKDIQYLDFLRDFGKHFSINRMVGFEFVKSRLDQNKPLSFLEFNYMILQAYDFYVLNEKQDCILQLGGSDQWANILNGVELVRKVKNKTVHGLTVPLLTTASGAKMGKTAGGAVWLNEDMCSAYDFWQYWRNVDDKDVMKCLKFFTDLPIEEAVRIGSLEGAEINEAKKILADEVTSLLHGKEALPAIHNTVQKLFEQSKGGDLDSLPSFEISDETMRLVDLLVLTKLCKSNGEAKKAIMGGAVRLKDEKLDDPFAEITIEPDMTLSFGKKNHVRILKK